MLTQDKIAEVLQYVSTKINYINYAYRMYDIYNQNITPYLRERIVQNFKGENSKIEAMSRLSTVNMLPKIVNKLSKAYTQVLVSNTGTGQSEIDDIVQKIDLQSKRHTINQMLNLNKCCAIEPVFPEGSDPFIRVLPAHTFLVYSDDPLNPEKVTHFIKIVEAPFAEVQSTENFGVKSFLNNATFYIYDSESWVEVKSGSIVREIQEHSYGTVPFVYLKRDTTELLPRQSRDDYEMVTLLPLLLTDNNFALKYKAFSIHYAINCEASDMELGPNIVWHFQATGGEGDKASVGTLTPTLNTDEAITNITTQYALWLETKGLKSPVFSTTGSTNQELSGIAKIIDEADVSSDIEKQRDILSEAENKLFILMEKMGLPNGFNFTFGDVSTSFTNVESIPEVPREKQDRVIQKYTAGFSSKVRAVQELYNIDSLEKAQELLEKIEQERLSEGASNVQTDNALQDQEAQGPE